MGVPTPPNSDQSTAQNNSRNSSNSSSSSDSSVPTSGSDAVVKGLGSLFGKKKQQQKDNTTQSPNAPPPNPNPDPNALMEMTTYVTSFSDSPLDATLFDIPAGYAQVQQNPDQMFNRPAPRPH
jgi:hypothetical protein